MLKVFIRFFLFFLGATFLLSCGASKREDVVYFQDIANFETQVNTNILVTKFKVDDLIEIYVSSLNPETSAPFNLFRGDPNRSGQPEQVDYLVDQAGEIDFPVIGKLKVVGLTPDELRMLLRDRLSEYLKDPIINIGLTNFTVTVLGNVNSPGTYPVSGELKISILEAIGLAGDLSITGVRDNVLVIRDYSGTKVYNRIDLTSKNMTKSPVYYLTQNDVVYVEPNKRGISASALDTSQKTQIAVTIFSVLLTSAVILATRN